MPQPQPVGGDHMTQPGETNRKDAMTGKYSKIIIIKTPLGASSTNHNNFLLP